MPLVSTVHGMNFKFMVTRTMFTHMAKASCVQPVRHYTKDTRDTSKIFYNPPFEQARQDFYTALTKKPWASVAQKHIAELWT